MNTTSMIYDITPATDRLSAVVSADPGQPYLAHHDVGAPLLGTVMSLEAMAECVFLTRGKKPRRISDVTAGEDCLIPAPKDLWCALHPHEGTIQTKLANRETPIFSCDFFFESPVAFNREMPPAEHCPVAAGIIYNCFFHGPAFQVVEEAYLSGQSLISRFHADVPPLNHDPARTPVLPVQAMEFCLQTAGLLDAALRQYLSVPLSIGEVILYDTEDHSGLWAQANITDTGTDIHAFNSHGQSVLSVLDYRTKPMPGSSKGFHALCKSFNP